MGSERNLLRFCDGPSLLLRRVCWHLCMSIYRRPNFQRWPKIPHWRQQRPEARAIWNNLRPCVLVCCLYLETGILLWLVSRALSCTPQSASESLNTCKMLLSIIYVHVCLSGRGILLVVRSMSRLQTRRCICMRFTLGHSPNGIKSRGNASSVDGGKQLVVH